ncbi:SET domain-containing protein [Annulohypoxylon moriforme]|nr:SET domain-containing protein [Annulohypoxylon moriforme]
MGIDAGFDMVPRLSKEKKDQQAWESFINSIRDYYKDDPQVEIKPHCIEFNAGEHPTLPFQGHKFLRFSSKVSGRIAESTGVSKYIDMVTRIAKIFWGSRVQYWNEAADQWGHYDWNEVYASMKTYQEPQPAPTTIETVDQALANLQLTLFEVRQIPGKGRGLVATSDIARGTRIVSEKPLFTIDSMPQLKIEEIIAAKIKALPKEQQRQYLSLHNNFPGRRPFTGIARTNCLPCGSGSTVGAVYPTICLINHSCLPNACNNWNEDDEIETIHAVRPISAGEEITIDYSNAGPSDVRQAKLRDSFGIDCDCTVCSLPKQELEASDCRRLEIQRLDEAIGDALRMMSSPNLSLADCQSLARVLEEEYGDTTTPLKARVYYDAFQICVAHSDRVRASAFAEKAYEVRVICEGDDSPLTKRMKCLAEDPTSHSNFGGYSKRWKGSDKFSPSSLSTTEFDLWLWRHAN